MTPRGMIRSARESLRVWRDIRAWERLGKPVPPPHSIKIQTILSHARKFQCATLVETGTYVGNTVEAVRNDFSRIFSIELDNGLFEKAKTKFSRDQHVEILQGDSAQILPRILNGIHRPALFWLDAHYSGAGTAKGGIETPILTELSLLLAHAIKNHIVLIDDARLFNGLADYPSLRELTDMVSSGRPDLEVYVENDIIRITPRAEKIA